MSVLDVHRDGIVVRATLNRPEKLNALDHAVREALEQLVRELADDPAVTVLVLQGAGRGFSAGADLNAPNGMAGLDWAGRRHEGGRWQRLLDDVEALPQATVARVHGPCVGGAVLLALACDLRVAADDAVFSIPEVAIGIPLTWAGLPRLVREIGLPRTRDLVMTGRPIDAATALDWGVVQRLVPAPDLDTATDALVAELAAMPAGPLAMTAAALRAIGRSVSGADAAWADPDLIAWALRDPETGEAAARYRKEHLE